MHALAISRIRFDHGDMGAVCLDLLKNRSGKMLGSMDAEIVRSVQYVLCNILSKLHSQSEKVASDF